MPLWRYIKKGTTFSPDEVAQMGIAFQGAIETESEKMMR